MDRQQQIANIQVIFRKLRICSNKMLTELRDIKVEVDTDNVIHKLNKFLFKTKMLKNSFAQACLFCTKNELQTYVIEDVYAIQNIMEQIIASVAEKKETVMRMPAIDNARESLERLV